MRSFSRVLGWLLVVTLVWIPTARSYVLDNQLWQGPTVTMQLQLDPTPLGRTLIDGSTSWGQVAEAALNDWNATMLRMQFGVVRNSTALLGRPNGLNNVFFSNTVYGDAWGSGVVGVAITYTNSTRRLESDVIFNSNRSWDSYRGNMRASLDLKRVALHEFGHVVGLDHPDQSGQSVTAIMNSTVGNLDSLAADDRAGAVAGYGTPGSGIPPPTIVGVSFVSPATVGSSVSFTVTVTGTAPFTYQWYKNTVLIPGATGVTYTLSNVQAGDAGSYTVTVTNGGGGATSLPSVLVVSTPTPVIVTQPASQTVIVGGSASFTVSATGSGVLSYQWYRNSVSVPGATAATLSLSNIQLGQAGNYTVVVSNAGGSATSNVATLTVNPPPSPPVILSHPASQTAIVGGSVTLSVSVSGTAPFIYQWMRDGAVISGASGSSLVLNNLTLSDAGGYTVVVTNAIGSVTSNAAVIGVNSLPVAPSLSGSPTSRSVQVGTAVSFSVIAGGTAPLTFVWRKNDVIIPGAGQATLSFPSVQTSDAGVYTVTVSNSAGSVTSPPATLTVTVPATAPAITTPPASQSVLTGASVTFSVAATGTTPLSYQWRKDGAPIPGATGATLVLNAVQGSDAGGYSVTVSNAGGTVTSPVATLTVTLPPTSPVIISHPVAVSASVGSPATFSVTAGGTAPLRYQWRQGNATIAGATQATFTIATVQLTDGGNYSVVVSNALGSVTSTPAFLTVLIPATPPVILVPPSGLTVTVGATVTLSVQAGGTQPLFYQWRRGGVAVPAGTGTSLVLHPVQATDAGSYTVTVTNAAGSVTSAPVSLVVNPAAIAPVITVPPASQTVATGGTATFAVTATGTAPLTYQWRHQNVDLPGATGSTLTLTDLQAVNAGAYTVVVGNAAGTATSPPATLVVSPPLGSRISNVSIRTTLAANQPLIVGLSMAGGSKPVLVRAVGPGLAAFGVGDAMTDPELALFGAGQLLAGNDDWGGGADLAAAFSAVGAFGLAPASLDAALLGPVDGGRTAQVSGPAGGNVLVEAYDAGTGNTPRLVNVSARNRIGSGGDVLIAGFTLTGNTTKTVLIRAVGPTLGAFGVPGALADPRLEVYSGATRVDENDDWPAALAATFERVGAFALTPGSRDSALLLTLPPGGYTVQVSGAGGTSGEALIELYEVPSP